MTAAAQADKAERAKMRAAIKRRKAQLLRQLADAEDYSAQIDEKLAGDLGKIIASLGTSDDDVDLLKNRIACLEQCLRLGDLRVDEVRAKASSLRDRLQRIETMAEETIRTGGRVELHPEDVRSIARGE